MLKIDDGVLYYPRLIRIHYENGKFCLLEEQRLQCSKKARILFDILKRYLSNILNKIQDLVNSSLSCRNLNLILFVFESKGLNL